MFRSPALRLFAALFAFMLPGRTTLAADPKVVDLIIRPPGFLALVLRALLT